MAKNQIFEGIVTPMVTPFIDSETIDTASLHRLLDHLIAGGVSGIFLMGATGEGASMSPRLKRELIKQATQHVAHRVPVLVHIADCCLEESISLAEYSRECGVDYLVSALPFYLGLTNDEIVEYYTRLADAVKLPLFLYNIPAQTKLMISVDAVKRLCTHPNIIGMKDSSGNGTYFNTLLAEVKDVNPDFSIMVGPDEMLASTMALGGNGGVNSGSNMFPELYVALFNACKTNDKERIARLQRIVMKVSTDIYGIDGTPMSFMKGIKSTLFGMGIIGNVYACPLKPVSDKAMEVITANAAKIKQMIAEAL
jgi:4-hydroxy-tetrahydrodipicolinate synthase